MRRFVTAIALTIVVSSSVFAGDIPSVGVPQPPPPGEIPSGGMTQAADDMTDAAISGLLALLGIVI